MGNRCISIGFCCISRWSQSQFYQIIQSGESQNNLSRTFTLRLECRKPSLDTGKEILGSNKITYKACWLRAGSVAATSDVELVLVLELEPRQMLAAELVSLSPG